MWKTLTKIIFIEIAILIALIGIYAQINGQYRPTQSYEPICKVAIRTLDSSRKVRKESSKGITKAVREDSQVVRASWYDRSVCGKRIYGETCKTASGEIFNDEDLTVAHKTLGFGVVVEFRHGDRTVSCRVNDRGPFIDGREFDLSYGCGNALGIIKEGTPTLEWKIK